MCQSKAGCSYERALITGASRGIGAAFARALPSATDVLLAGRDREALEEVAAEVAAPGRRVDIAAADLGSAAGRRSVIDHAQGFEVDLLINNAGTGTFAAFADTPAADLEAAVAVNVLAPVLLTRELLPGMLERARRGRRRAGLIFVSSALAFLPVPRLAAYGASKSFLLALTEALDVELADEPIDTLALCPGPTRTAFGRRAGYQLGNLPGAASPDAVAREGLDALGTRRTAVTGALGGLSLGPVAQLRTLATRASGLASNLLAAGARR